MPDHSKLITWLQERIEVDEQDLDFIRTFPDMNTPRSEEEEKVLIERLNKNRLLLGKAKLSHKPRSSST